MGKTMRGLFLVLGISVGMSFHAAHAVDLLDCQFLLRQWQLLCLPLKETNWYDVRVSVPLDLGDDDFRVAYVSEEHATGETIFQNAQGMVLASLPAEEGYSPTWVLDAAIERGVTATAGTERVEWDPARVGLHLVAEDEEDGRNLFIGGVMSVRRGTNLRTSANALRSTDTVGDGRIGVGTGPQSLGVEGGVANAIRYSYDVDGRLIESSCTGGISRTEWTAAGNCLKIFEGKTVE